MMAFLNQILIMAVLFVIGVLCYKFNIISKEANKSLSSFVVNIVNPAMLINSYQIEFSMERLRMLMFVFILSFLSYAIVIPLSNVLNRKGQDRNIDRIATIYSNCGFIGIPIINSIYGAEGVFYLSGYITAFNLLFWTHGITVMEKKFDKSGLKRMILSPAILAIIVGITFFLLHIKIIDPFGKTIALISDTTTPLSMVIAGVSIAQTNFLKTVKQVSIYKVTFLRLIFMPLVIFAVFLFIPLPTIVKNIVIFGCACPASTMGTIIAIKMGKNDGLMSQYFAATTVLSVITLPVIQLMISLIPA